MKQSNMAIIYPTFHLVNHFHQFRKTWLSGIIITSYLLLFLNFLSHYFITDVTIWTIVLLSPYIIKVSHDKEGNTKFLWLSLIFGLFTIFTSVQTFYFLAIGFAILFAIECFAGNIGYLPLFLLALLSPTFKYFNNMFGFPVRITLSEWAGNIIRLLGYKIEIIGNVIVKNGIEFSVDPACVGLKMMAFSILAGLMIMAYNERKNSKNFSFIKITLMLTTIVVLNIVSNLIRIVILTLFEILPDNPFHELIGIVCFIAYVIIPSYFMIQYAGKKSKKVSIDHKTWSLKSKTIVNILLLAFIALIGFVKVENKSISTNNNFEIAGYKKQIVNGDVMKLEKSGILLYIKPLSKFYGAEHNPMICWTGSGYQFSKINTRTIARKDIYTGILKKGNDIIYSAWWFDNGQYQTISQLNWRWRALKGENFYLVNFNSNNQKTLEMETFRWINARKNINNQ